MAAPSFTSSSYPSSNQISIFGPVYLPQVYAKDLAALQIASSGRVDVVLNDAPAFSIAEAAGTTSLVPAASSPTIALSSANSNAYVAVNAAEGSVTIHGQRITLDGNLTIMNNNNQLSMFVFRTNDADELELLKIIDNESNVVARFGRTYF